MPKYSAELAAAIAEAVAPLVDRIDSLAARIDALLAPMEANAAAEAQARALNRELEAEAHAHLDAIGASEKARAWFMTHATTRERLSLLVQLKSERLETCALRGPDFDAQYVGFSIRLDAAIEWERQHPELVQERDKERLRAARKGKRRGS